MFNSRNIDVLSKKGKDGFAMKKMTMWMLGLQIEHKWKQIGRNRVRMDALVGKGGPYTSPKLIRLDEMTAKLGCDAVKLECEYRKLTDISSPATGAI